MGVRTSRNAHAHARQLKASISKVTQIIILFLWSIKRVVRIDVICAGAGLLWCDSFTASQLLDRRNVAAVAVHCSSTLDNFAGDLIASNYCQMCAMWALRRDTNWIAKFDFSCRLSCVGVTLLRRQSNETLSLSPPLMRYRHRTKRVSYPNPNQIYAHGTISPFSFQARRVTCAS